MRWPELEKQSRTFTKSEPPRMRYGNTIIRWVVSPFGFGVFKQILPQWALQSHLNSIHYRPVNERGERVTPSALETHRISHKFLGPCCFCAMVAPAPTPVLEEAAIFLDESKGRQIGEYIAACARGTCRYKGVLIES